MIRPRRHPCDTFNHSRQDDICAPSWRFSCCAGVAAPVNHRFSIAGVSDVITFCNYSKKSGKSEDLWSLFVTRGRRDLYKTRSEWVVRRTILLTRSKTFAKKSKIMAYLQKVITRRRRISQKVARMGSKPQYVVSITKMALQNPANNDCTTIYCCLLLGAGGKPTKRHQSSKKWDPQADASKPEIASWIAVRCCGCMMKR